MAFSPQRTLLQAEQPPSPQLLNPSSLAFPVPGAPSLAQIWDVISWVLSRAGTPDVLALPLLVLPRVLPGHCGLPRLVPQPGPFLELCPGRQAQAGSLAGFPRGRALP